jgi:isoleucyl-tRNA synthetase
MIRAIYQFCVVDLSACYFDARKDRLYADAPAWPQRRCAQTVLYDILLALVKGLAPVLAITTEEVWQEMRAQGWVAEASVHLGTWPELPAVEFDEAARARWATLLSIREAAMKALEEQRGRDVIGSPLEAQVTLLVATEALRTLCEDSRETLEELCVVSGLRVQMDEPACATPNAQLAGLAAAAAAIEAGLVDVRVERAAGAKCQRCWKYLASVGKDAAHPQLCDRCVKVVQSVVSV